jgi:hypothetical protein
MTDRIALRATLCVRSPFLFRGLEAPHFGLDAPQLRDEEGRPIIPGDQLRGVLREALVDLAEVGVVDGAAIDDLFGRSSSNEGQPGTSNDPERGRIVVSDMTACGMLCDLADPAEEKEVPPPEEACEATRIEIEDALGSAREGMLQVVELAAPFGAAVRFSGEIVVFRLGHEAGAVEAVLNRALKLVPAIGAFKSAGFGEVLADRSKVELIPTVRPLAMPARPVALPSSNFVRLRVIFDRPLLVDAERLSTNAFRGSAIVPGAVFKGALARRLTLAGYDTMTGPLGQALSELSFSHAFPESDAAGEPGLLPLPLSLVAAKDDDERLHFGDALRVPEDRGAVIANLPGLFQSDWKEGWFDAEALRLALGRPPADVPGSLARTRTEIKDGIAKDTALFTSIARSVRRNGSNRAWLIDVDLGAIEEDAIRDCAALLVTALLEDGLDNIGKTGAHGRFEQVDGAVPARLQPIAGATDRYAIVLATPALMLDPTGIWGTDGSPQMTPRAAYEAYWKSLVPGCELHSFYAAQRLAGGYLAHRRRLYGRARYFPFLLTEPGSIFEIETDDRRRLESLWRFGLPPAELQYQGAMLKLDWSNCPYLPENGYGRIFGHLITEEQMALLGSVDNV